MKSPIANLALSLVLLSTSATLSSAIPAPLPSPTGYASNSEEALAAEAARAQLRPVWRPGPRLDARSDASLAPTPLAAGLSPRGPIFSRRNQESKFNYRKRTSAGLAVAGNIAYGLNERDIAAPFGIGNGNVPLPVAMRVRRDASLVERDDDEEEEDWDCSEYDDNDGDDDDDWEGENEDEASSAPGPSSSQAAASSSSSESPKQEKPSSSSAAPAPSSSSSSSPSTSNTDNSSNHASNQSNPLLTNNVIGTKKDDNASESNSKKEPEPAANSPGSSTSSSEESAPSSSSEDAYMPALPTSSSTAEVYQPEATKKASAKKSKSKSKSKSSSSKAVEPTLTTPSDIAPGTLTVEQGCIRYHTVVAGEVCLGLLDWSKDLGLTLEQLYQYNPAIDSECLNLQIGWGVCIGAQAVSSPSTSSTSSSTASTTSTGSLQRRCSLF